MKIERTQVIAAICNRMDALHLRYAIVFNPASIPVAPPYIPLAEALADHLATGNEAAVRVARALVGFDDLQDPRFWALDFGRLLFLASGSWENAISQKIAASLLGCSRQYVHALATSGKLRSDLGGVPAAPGMRLVHAGDVRDLLKAKIDK